MSVGMFDPFGSVDSSLISASAIEINEERTRLAEEWPVVRAAAICADDHFAAAQSLQREQELQFAAHEANSIRESVRERWECLLESRLESQRQQSQLRLSVVESQIQERLRAISAAGEDKARQIAQTCRAEISVLEENTESQEVAVVRERELLHLGLANIAADGRKRFENVTCELHQRYGTSIRLEEESWMAHEAPIWQANGHDMLLRVRRTEERVEHREEHVRANCSIEEACAEVRSTARAEAWEAREWALAQANAEAAATLENAKHETRMHLATHQIAEKIHAAKYSFELKANAWQQERAKLRELRNAECIEAFAELEAQHFAALLDERRRSLAQRRAASEEVRAQQHREHADLHSARRAEMTANSMSYIKQDRILAEQKFRQQLAAIEAVQKDTNLQADACELGRERVQREYQQHVSDVLIAQSDLDQERKRLSEATRVSSASADNRVLASSVVAQGERISRSNATLSHDARRPDVSTVPLSNSDVAREGSSYSFAPIVIREVSGPVVPQAQVAPQITIVPPNSTFSVNSPSAGVYDMADAASSVSSPAIALVAQTPKFSKDGDSDEDACLDEQGGLSARKQVSTSVPTVYAAAISAVERFGWEKVHGGNAEWTALHWAASVGRTEICARLLKANGDPRQPDHVGKCALDYAYDAGHILTWRILAGAGSESPPSSPAIHGIT
eukprot:TRINITY_DN26847_c0_g7_i1.p1 TRINITY_DN26847_c0_g7~~TRINITY_DN26847_c0_g7_i1.p1  ORF type:complete len:704 (-),score=67.15 TRINITY_DN26847_c0_g7_i1:11-2065(-)